MVLLPNFSVPSVVSDLQKPLFPALLNKILLSVRIVRGDEVLRSVTVCFTAKRVIDRN